MTSCWNRVHTYAVQLNLVQGEEKLRLWLLSVSLLNTEREVQAKANKRQSADVREKESAAAQPGYGY